MKNRNVPSVSVTYAQTGSSTKSPPASGKSRALMFIALEKLFELYTKMTKKGAE